MSHKLVLCLLAYVSGLAVGLSLNYKFRLGSQDEYKINVKTPICHFPWTSASQGNKFTVTSCRYLVGIITVKIKIYKKISDTKQLKEN